MKTKIKIAVIALIGMSLGIQSQTEHLDGQTKLINPEGRTLLIERDDNDSWLTFHDKGDSWYSMGIDISNSGSFNLNYGGILNSSQFVMDRTGKIGIGTSSPNSKLTINDGALSFTGSASLPMASLGLHDSNFMYLIGGSAGLKLTDDGLHGITVVAGGNVGIGTVSPSSKLELMNGSDGISFDASNNWIGVGFNRSVKTGQIFDVNKSGWQLTARDNRFAIEGYNGATNNLLSILKNGNVGIGTTQPDMELTVNGKIHAKEVKIDLAIPAPDYVFKSEYKLRSIEEVESFIKKHSHLPEIPSAKEFAENGVMQAEMDMNLLKKIEELTLYTIEQYKKMKIQEKKIDALEKQNSRIKDLEILVQKLLKDKN